MIRTHADLPRCPRTGLAHYILDHPDDVGPSASVVFYLNGIGLDALGFTPALEALCEKGSPARFARHVAITTPGFEDEVERMGQAPLAMAEQAERLADFIHHHLEEAPAPSVLIYGFSFGSDLAVELFEALKGRKPLPLRRAILAELNVSQESCFITRRIRAAFEEAQAMGGRHHAYTGFLARVVEAHESGLLSKRLWRDMTEYCHSIARKDWRQLAHSAAGASDSPEARVRRFLALSADYPDAKFELCFTDPADLKSFQRIRSEFEAPVGRLKLLDDTRHEHFRAMQPEGLQELLEGRLKEVHARIS